MDWIALMVAGACEIFGVAMLNRFQHTKRVWVAMLIVLGFSTSLFCLSYAMQTLPMGLSYAIWTGIGAVGSALMGMWLYGESKEWKRLGFLAIIISSIIGLKLTA